MLVVLEQFFFLLLRQVLILLDLSGILVVARVGVTIVEDGVVFRGHLADGIQELILIHLLVELIDANADLFEGIAKDLLITLGCVLEQVFLLLLVGIILFLLTRIEQVQLLLDLLLEFLIIDIDLLVQVQPRHIGGHGTVADLLDQVFDLLQQGHDIVTFVYFVLLMPLFAFVIHLKVLLSGINQVELNVEVEIV